jgi:hypothetical protein
MISVSLGLKIGSLVNVKKALSRIVLLANWWILQPGRPLDSIDSINFLSTSPNGWLFALTCIRHSRHYVSLSWERKRVLTPLSSSIVTPLRCADSSRPCHYWFEKALESHTLLDNRHSFSRPSFSTLDNVRIFVCTLQSLVPRLLFRSHKDFCFHMASLCTYELFFLFFYSTIRLFDPHVIAAEEKNNVFFL